MKEYRGEAATLKIEIIRNTVSAQSIDLINKLATY